MKKKKWSLPKCSKVKLLPEEAILAVCKGAGQSGRDGLGCTGVAGQGTKCNQLGS